jgi:hypothetical protein
MPEKDVEEDLAAELRELCGIRDFIDQMIEDAVLAMRDEGRSWAEIGKPLGVTRQAAMKRYGQNQDAPS